MPIKHSSVKAI